ncbi:MAG TPA: glycosyltransferase family A protein [Solirubrobacterales bacterium]|jgi:glycosyltransferase involved in cell wall biosynthesis|nr:glycosyltransferase family A protein [Solirubrobacterales bacterium]
MTAAGGLPAVDVVVNNHDYGDFVEAAVRSAQRQAHPDVQVIVVDDGSTDDSRSRLAAFEGEVDLVFKQNGGQASALNAGLRRCRGEAVIFLDADDVLKPDAAARVAAAFAADPGLVKVQFQMDVIDAEGRPTGAVKPASHLPLPNGDVRRAELAFPFDIAWLPTSGNAFRIAALRKIFPIPEQDYPFCGADWYLVHLTALLGRVASLPQACASYRVHGTNNYEPASPTLDLKHVRQSIAYAGATTVALTRLADELGQERPERILSVSDLANRLVSRRLEPARHPIPGDSRRRILVDGLRATTRRFDVSWPMRALFALWFVLAALSPRPLARRLGEAFLLPERRPRLNGLLAHLHL